MPGAANDVLRAVQVLPGVARIPFAFGGLVLRGTSPRDTEVYLDGIEVPIAFHFGGITSFYPSQMLADLQLTSGGFDASYGRAEGGIVTLTTREPRTDRWRVGGTLGLLDSGVMAEGPVAGGGMLIGIRRSYFDTVVAPFVDDDVPLPSYWDAELRTSFGDPGKRGRITPLVFLSIDHVANQASGDPGQSEKVALTSMFVRAAVPYLRQWGPLALHVVPWLGTNRLTFDDRDDGREQSFTRPLYLGGLRADLTRDEPWGHVRGGIDGQSGYLSASTIDRGTTRSTVAWSDLALWAETRIKIDGDRFAVKPGLRVEGYGLSREWVIDPRVNVHERLTDTLTLRQSLGRYHQPPTPGDVDPHQGNPALTSSYFDQASLGVDALLGHDFTASVTGYYSYGQRLGVREPTYRPGDDFEPDLGGLGPTFELLLEKQLGYAIFRSNKGRAKTRGLEVLVKRHVGRWFGMIAYTLSQSERTDDPALYAGWRPFELDQRHNLNVAGSVALAHWRVGARVQLVSGNPYSPSKDMPWSATLPPFFSLDVRADRSWHRSWSDINLYLDLQNVTNRRNIEGREGAVDTPGLPIIPMIGVEFIPP